MSRIFNIGWHITNGGYDAYVETKMGNGNLVGTIYAVDDVFTNVWYEDGSSIFCDSNLFNILVDKKVHVNEISFGKTKILPQPIERSKSKQYRPCSLVMCVLHYNGQEFERDSYIDYSFYHVPDATEWFNMFKEIADRYKQIEPNDNSKIPKDNKNYTKKIVARIGYIVSIRNESVIYVSARVRDESNILKYKCAKIYISKEANSMKIELKNKCLASESKQHKIFPIRETKARYKKYGQIYISVGNLLRGTGLDTKEGRQYKVIRCEDGLIIADTSQAIG